MNYSVLPLLLALLIFVGFACGSDDPPVVVTVLAAAIGGSLIEEDGCLRIGDSSGSNAIVWQKDVLEVERQGNTFQIIKGDKQPVTWRLGDEIRSGGGFIGSEVADEHAGAGFSERCPGPYWLLGMVGVPREESANPTVIASATALPPRTWSKRKVRMPTNSGTSNPMRESSLSRRPRQKTPNGTQIVTVSHWMKQLCS